jgi:hypothetical protein
MDDGTGITRWDSWLWPFAQTLRDRRARVKELESLADKREGGLLAFARSYRQFGLHPGKCPRTGVPGVTYHEWAPAGAPLHRSLATPPSPMPQPPPCTTLGFCF